MSFIGRKRELEVLKDAFDSGKSAFIPVYGRRRVGKSELILHFMRGKPGLYFLGLRAPSGLQIREFLKCAAQSLKEPLLEGYSANDWKSALEAFEKARPSGKKLILVFDEFQWTAEAGTELPSVLQHFWDRKWKASGDIVLIVCGSYIGFMEREVLGKKSPLFGRRTAQIFLRPFPYNEAADFHPSWSLTDKARAYFICGGIPLYHQYFSNSMSVEMNIIRNILDPHAPMFLEPDFLLREEFRELRNYYAILMAVASSINSQAEIARHVGMDSRSLDYYLKQLTELRYLTRRYPLSGETSSARNVRYVLDDPLLSFWFRFIYPMTGYIMKNGPKSVFRERIQPQLTSYFGRCFESLCREALPDIYQKNGIEASLKVGQYWDRHVQIDVVGLREDNCTDLGECKWGKVPAPASLEKELKEKTQFYPNRRNATIGKMIFTRLPLRKKRKPDRGIDWYSLKDIYS